MRLQYNTLVWGKCATKRYVVVTKGSDGFPRGITKKVIREVLLCFPACLRRGFVGAQTVNEVAIGFDLIKTRLVMRNDLSEF